MDNVTRFPGAVARTRIESFKQLWPQGYGRKRMLQHALDNKLFSESELEESKTPDGMERLYEKVSAEFKEIQDRNVAKRRETIVQLLALGLNEREITEQLLDRKLLHNPKFSSAYFNVQKDVQRMVARMRAEDARFIPVAKSLYIRQQTRIMREAVLGANAAVSRPSNPAEAEGFVPDRRAQAALLMTAIKASQNIAVVSGVDVNGKLIDQMESFDIARETAEAIMAKTDEVMAMAAAANEGGDEYVGVHGSSEDEGVIDVKAEPVQGSSTQGA
jgi:hypothetical protein